MNDVEERRVIGMIGVNPNTGQPLNLGVRETMLKNMVLATACYVSGLHCLKEIFVLLTQLLLILFIL